MTDWTKSVQISKDALINEKDNTTSLILAMDNFLNVANKVGYVALVIGEIEEEKAILQEYISELNMQIEIQKA
jgi:hypothetical protein